MVETLLASAILAIGVAGVAEAVATAQQTTAESLVGLRANMLAEALLQEILSKPYKDPQGTTTWGPDAGETSRSLFDDVNDYHGYTDGPSNLADASGVAYPTEFQGYTRSVTVVLTTKTISGLPQPVTGAAITVTVTRNGRTWTATSFVGDPGSNG
jgi:MSHA pilin protein MshD